MKSKKTTPEIIARDCIAVRVRILNRVITKIYDEALRPLGVKTSQVNILVVTGRMGIVRPAEICSRLKMDMSTVSRNIDRLKAGGWIETLADEQDGRAHQIQLSKKGTAPSRKSETGLGQSPGRSAGASGSCRGHEPACGYRKSSERRVRASAGKNLPRYLYIHLKRSPHETSRTPHGKTASDERHR